MSTSFDYSGSAGLTRSPHTIRNAVSTMMSVVYGYHVESIEDEFVTKLEEYFTINGDVNK